MFFIEGRQFVNERPEVVIDYLKSLDKSSLKLNSEDFKFINRGKFIALQVFNNNKEFLIRKSFLNKYLKKFKFPPKLVVKFSPETLSHILNDLSISYENNLNVFIENNEAVSFGKTRIDDVELIMLIQKSENRIKSITRNDFFVELKLENCFDEYPIDGLSEELSPALVSEDTIKYKLD
ncbi:MAG TPA: hypothetical protein VFF33_07050 [Ignavibacteriaceae bacterium]|nr:hypothetical protein [Ignavibacteriaceae bacterium]